jgi:hypothetical protein
MKDRNMVGVKCFVFHIIDNCCKYEKKERRLCPADCWLLLIGDVCFAGVIGYDCFAATCC